MPDFTIPQQLITMIADQTVIPFVGAGFSASLEMPTWDKLLRRLAEEIEGARPFSEVAEACNNDFLQIAEYYFLKSNRNIGPIRLQLSQSLQTNSDPSRSSRHIELINLGATQIYTTNYDDVVEKTFRKLDQPVQVISLPKDVASSSSRKTSVVKYHGDLRFDSTLVLTESSYYTRLDFESPMDLKFRSDLLGKSVLFMGYSFRDINIRIIWHKLMQMMRDIPAVDRKPSYIVRFEPNDVLETLYNGVGLETIVLDPNNSCTCDNERSELLDEFLFELAQNASEKGKIPGSKQRQYLTPMILSKFREEATQNQQELDRLRHHRRRFFRPTLEASLAFQGRVSPKSLSNDVNDLIDDYTKEFSKPILLEAVVNLLDTSGPSNAIFSACIMAMCSEESRDRLFDLVSDSEWKNILTGSVNEEAFSALMKDATGELKGHIEYDLDDWDLGYCYYFLKFVFVNNRFTKPVAENDKYMFSISSLVDEIEDRYDGISDAADFTKPAKPDVDKILQIIEDVDIELRSENDGSDSPF